MRSQVNYISFEKSEIKSFCVILLKISWYPKIKKVNMKVIVVLAAVIAAVSAGYIPHGYGHGHGHHGYGHHGWLVRNYFRTCDNILYTCLDQCCASVKILTHVNLSWNIDLHNVFYYRALRNRRSSSCSASSTQGKTLQNMSQNWPLPYSPF